MYNVGFTSIDRPEIVIKNTHRSFQSAVTLMFFRVYDIMSTGTRFLPGHGVSSNGVKVRSGVELRSSATNSNVTNTYLLL